MGRNSYYNLEVEQSVIGALLLEGDLIKDCTLHPDQLYSRKHRTILSVMQRVDEKGIPIDVVSVAEKARPDNWDNIGRASYLTTLSRSVSATANFNFYQDTVKKYDQKRKTCDIANRIKQASMQDEIETVLRDGIHALQMVEDYLSVESQGEISRALKQMAKEMNVVMITLSQLSRAVESRLDKHPMLSDLRDSSQID